MFGAYRPPWVSKKEFYKTPFNYCDRWCERCRFTDRCRVFQREQESRQRWLKRGGDPDSWEYALNTVKGSFREVRKLLTKEAKRRGIDPKTFNDSDSQPLPPPEQFPSYNVINKFSQSLEKILKELRVVPIDADEKLIMENTEIISYYRPLIVVKIYRALTSKIEEEEENLGTQTFDAKNSAFIVVNSLILIADALKNLAQHEPLRLLRDELRRLGKISLDLTETVDWEFDLNVLDTRE